MAFVNEYVSEEDIQKYKLDDLWNQYQGITADTKLGKNKNKMPELRLKGYKKIHWTHDKVNNNWFIFMKHIYSYGETPSGLPEPSGEQVFCFYFNKHPYSVNLKRLPRSSVNSKDNPYIIAWQLLKIVPNDFDEKQKRLFTEYLKEALIKYGDRGCEGTISNALVEFEI